MSGVETRISRARSSHWVSWVTLRCLVSFTTHGPRSVAASGRDKLRDSELRPSPCNNDHLASYSATGAPVKLLKATASNRQGAGGRLSSCREACDSLDDYIILWIEETADE